MNYSFIKTLLSQKKIILFGAGHVGRIVASVLAKYSPAYFVDNDQSKHFTQIDGIDVFPIQHLLEEMKENIFIIITSENPSIILEMFIQLTSMGYKQGFHFELITKLLPRISSITNCRSTLIGSGIFVMSEVIDESIEYKGKNTIETEAGITEHNYSVVFGGDNNKLIIHSDCIFNDLNIVFLGRNSIIEIQNNANILSGMINTGSDNIIRIGNNFSARSSLEIHAREGGIVEIGNDCLLSYEVRIFQSDMHPIYGKHNGERTNHKKNVYIGNHVWLGRNTCVLGGAEIGDGSVIGLGSIVTGKIPGDVVAAGNPAKVIRENIYWSKDEFVFLDP